MNSLLDEESEIGGNINYLVRLLDLITGLAVFCLSYVGGGL